MSQRYKMIVAYDGTEYAGWQIQPNGVTIQSELERVVKQVTGETVRIHGSGRTDSGVHAREQVAHFDLPAPVKRADKIRMGGNALLDPAIRIYRVTPVADTFHARYSVTRKQYRYFVYTGPDLPPHVRSTRFHVRGDLDLATMQEAASLLVGKHDFAAFSANPKRVVESTVREVYRLEVRKKGHEITMIAEGEGFLYKMVRSLAGMLIRVGRGELTPSDVAAILDSKERTARVPSAQPQGLFLWAVRY